MIERRIASHGLGIEIERKPSVGVGSIIIGFDQSRNGQNATDPLIYLHQELKSNPATEKIAGQFSIPLERKTIGETEQNNRLRALAEVIDDSRLSYFRQHLYVVRESIHENKGSLRGNPVDLMILIYDGDLNIAFSPFSKDVGPIGWVSLEDFHRIENVRPLARQLVGTAEQESLIYKAVFSWEQFPGKRQLFIPIGFSVEESEIKSNKIKNIIE